MIKIIKTYFKLRAAKKLTIKVWSYLALHPDINRKKKLPYSLWKEVEKQLANCPLCEALKSDSCYHGGTNCNFCPLQLHNNLDCFCYYSWYSYWEQVGSPLRPEYIENIVSQLNLPVDFFTAKSYIAVVLLTRMYAAANIVRVVKNWKIDWRTVWEVTKYQQKTIH